VSLVSKVRTTSYLPASQQLYRWLVLPLEEVLQTRVVGNLLFIVDEGLRSLPLSALHDGQDSTDLDSGQFLVEKYSVGLSPSLRLTNTRYSNLSNARVLAMGASQFPADSNFQDLPLTETELSLLLEDPWDAATFFNAEFTLDNLKRQRQERPFGILHLATHAQFKKGNLGNSFIQLYDSRLQLDQIRDLGWNDPPLKLLVLSACQTALGDRDAELGFAGLAAKTGVQSVLGTLWYVRGEGTFPLMGEFYNQLDQAAIKAEALRQAQIAMLRRQVRYGYEGDRPQLVLSDGQTLPFDAPEDSIGDPNLSHPYYWAVFTLIGSPW